MDRFLMDNLNNKCPLTPHECAKKSGTRLSTARSTPLSVSHGEKNWPII